MGNRKWETGNGMQNSELNGNRKEILQTPELKKGMRHSKWEGNKLLTDNPEMI